MVFKSDNRMFKGIILKYDIVNQTWASLFGIEVNKGKTFDSSLIGIIIMSQKLVTTADCNDASSVFNIIMKIFLNCS